MPATKDKPLYQIIRNDIQNIIHARDFDYDKPICTEKSICERYNVSRITAKHAINALENDGIMYRKRGVGSFAVRPPEDTAKANTTAENALVDTTDTTINAKTDTATTDTAVNSATRAAADSSTANRSVTNRPKTGTSTTGMSTTGMSTTGISTTDMSTAVISKTSKSTTSVPTTSIPTSNISAARYKVFALLTPFAATKGGIFRAIESAGAIFSRNQCQLHFHISELNIRREKEILEQLYAQDVDGIIYYPWMSTLPLEVLNRFVEKNRPVIILDKTCHDTHLSSVVCDNYDGGYSLAAHLVSYGHTQTCYLSRFTPDELSSIHDRYTGYAACLADNNIDYPPRFVHWDTRTETGYPMLKHLVNGLYRDGVTAILCENDEVAFNVHMCCRSLGLRIPENMNITGFDNIDWATTGSAQITTVDQNFPLIGETLADILLQTEYTPRQHTLPIRLIPRNSTGKAVD